MSASQIKAQEDGCWNYVLNTEGGKRAAIQTRTALTLVYGAVGLAAELAQPPKKQAANIQVFNSCMKKQGYVLAKKGS